MISIGKGDVLMSSQEIHDRILKEINLLVSDDKMRNFLIQILNYEISLMEQGKPTFAPRYVQIIENIYFK